VEQSIQGFRVGVFIQTNTYVFCLGMKDCPACAYGTYVRVGLGYVSRIAIRIRIMLDYFLFVVFLRIFSFFLISQAPFHLFIFLPRLGDPTVGRRSHFPIKKLRILFCCRQRKRKRKNAGFSFFFPESIFSFFSLSSAFSI
jgi:hypothetical protein